MPNILINKNVDGVISDAILTQQLSVIDREIVQTQSLLFKLDTVEVNLLEAVEFLEPYFKKPSKVWQKASLKTKLDLQVFEFPLGCTFINNLFGTPEISKFFKVKSELLTSNFGKVDIPPVLDPICRTQSLY